MMMHLLDDPLNFVADFGDVGALAPAAAASAFVLFQQRRRRAATIWLASLLVCISVIFASRIALGSFTLELGSWTLQSNAVLSGHAGLSACFYGGLASFAARRSCWKLVAASVLVAAGVTGLICWSIWMLEWHQALEIMAGLLWGGACASVAATLIRRNDRAPETWRAVAAPIVAAGALILLMHGVRVDDRGLLDMLRAIAA